MDLLLHTPNDKSGLARYYKQALEKASELFIVTAYLTDWDASLTLHPDCRSFPYGQKTHPFASCGLALVILE
jgi:hypothetical protein